jgi:septal ring factor EnvC (AmiA/AmiB activator)
MSTGVIIAIIVVVLILLALLLLLPRMRAKANEKKAQRELESRRERVATEHRETASVRATEADRAEQEAEIAQQKARAQRAEAEQHESEAKLHEQGLADDKLVEDHERDRFAGVSGGVDADRRDDEPVRDDAPAAGPGGSRAANDPNTEYEQGREDEAATRGDSPAR